MRKGKIKSKEHLAEIVRNSKSVSEVQRKLGYKYSGGVHKFLKGKFKEYGIDTLHFTGQGWAKGSCRETDERVNDIAKKNESKWEDIFKKGTYQVKNYVLLRRLILSGKREYSCEECGISNWQCQPLRLQLDHINGDSSDNREENLKVVCPNCHSQTTTFSRGQKKKSKNDWFGRWWRKLSME